MTRRWVSAGVSLVLGVVVIAAIDGGASAEREPSDLKALAPGQHVASVRHCRGVYEVTLKDGSVRSFKQYEGPDAAAPALVPTGRVGDRAFVVFAGLDELKAWIKTC